MAHPGPLAEGMNIGLTGGMGCGKSTALAYFQRCGSAVFEADRYVARLLADDTEVRKELRNHFGGRVFTAEGMVDRRALGRIVFGNSSKLGVLESLLHPRVRTAWQRELGQGHSCLVVEIPLLFEKSLASLFDVTVCVAAQPETQRNRLRARGLEDEQIDLRLTRQWPLSRKMEAANHILWNDGEEAHLRAQIDHLLKHWRISFA